MHIKLKNTSDQTHWWHQPTAQHGSHSSGPPECQVTQGSQTPCKRLKFNTMWFSCLSATNKRAQWLYVHIRQWSVEDVVTWLTNSPQNSLQLMNQLDTNDSDVQIPMLTFSLTAANTFTCEHLWTAFQLYMSCIWKTHTLANVLSCVFPHEHTHTHTHSFLLHDIMCMHSSLNNVPNNVSHLCSRISAIRALINTAWTQSVVAAGKILNRYILRYSNAYWETMLYSYVDSQHTQPFLDSCVFQQYRVRKISNEGNFAPRILTLVIKIACQMKEKAT
jgi:hypothetical protein